MFFFFRFVFMILVRMETTDKSVEMCVFAFNLFIEKIWYFISTDDDDVDALVLVKDRAK